MEPKDLSDFIDKQGDFLFKYLENDFWSDFQDFCIENYKLKSFQVLVNYIYRRTYDNNIDQFDEFFKKYLNEVSITFNQEAKLNIGQEKNKKQHNKKSNK